MREAIVGEIEERREFLESMVAMGKGGEHEAQIKGQIAERMRDLATLDSMRGR